MRFGMTSEWLLICYRAGLGFEDMKIIEVYELLDGLANDKSIYPDFREGWKVCQIIDAVLLSVEEGRWVSMDEI